MGLLNSAFIWEISVERRVKEHMTNEGKSQEKFDLSQSKSYRCCSELGFYHWVSKHSSSSKDNLRTNLFPRNKYKIDAKVFFSEMWVKVIGDTTSSRWDRLTYWFSLLKTAHIFWKSLFIIRFLGLQRFIQITLVRGSKLLSLLVIIRCIFCLFSWQKPPGGVCMKGVFQLCW